MTANHFPPGKTGGFTMLELLIVMMIMAVMAGLLIPRISGNQLTELKAQVREAVSVLKYARRSAVLRRETREVRFYPPAEEKRPAKSEAGQRTPTNWVSRGAVVAWEKDAGEPERDGKAYLIRFYPGGGCSGGELTLTQGKFEAKIILHPLTGKVKVELPES